MKGEFAWCSFKNTNPLQTICQDRSAPIKNVKEFVKNLASVFSVCPLSVHWYHRDIERGIWLWSLPYTVISPKINKKTPKLMCYTNCYIPDLCVYSLKSVSKWHFRPVVDKRAAPEKERNTISPCRLKLWNVAVNSAPEKLKYLWYCFVWHSEIKWTHMQTCQLGL